MCGKIDCDLCNIVGRNVRTLNVTVDNYNLREEVIRWVGFPAPNLTDSHHYLSLIESKKIDKDKHSGQKLLAHLPTVKDDSKEIKLIKEFKKLHNGCAFHATKVIAVAKRDDCAAWLCLFLEHAVGSSKGPTKK